MRTNEEDLIVILVMFALDEKARQNYLTGEKKSMKKSSLCFKRNKKSETIVC